MEHPERAAISLGRFDLEVAADERVRARGHGVHRVAEPRALGRALRLEAHRGLEVVETRKGDKTKSISPSKQKPSMKEKQKRDVTDPCFFRC